MRQRTLYVVAGLIAAGVLYYLWGLRSTLTADCVVRNLTTARSPDNHQVASVATRECREEFPPSGLFVFLKGPGDRSPTYELFRSAEPSRDVSLSWIDDRNLQIGVQGPLSDEESRYDRQSHEGITVHLVSAGSSDAQ